ncbi:proline rich transmembrane protein 1B-like [Centropristis striata]|uniref:proline rich transmembrane protein 1B-like n=1 Tax=Centropristis striata TaxID=184440 RepID=UPI0027E0B36B|nr:proline rich transmembrane protein 1B-like [Centropristis striata]
MERGQQRDIAPTYLGWSIFNTLCCCLPLGIAAIIYSVKADSANTHGDGARALEASRTARTLNVIALVCGIILLIIFIVLKTQQKEQ